MNNGLKELGKKMLTKKGICIISAIVLFLAALVMVICAFLVPVSVVEAPNGVIYKRLCFSNHYEVYEWDVTKIEPGQSDSSVVIEGEIDGYPVTVIRTAAFYVGKDEQGKIKDSTLKSVVISENITTIGSYAFMNCHKLESVVIPESVTEIKTSAFASCSSLKSVTLSANVTSIESLAFSQDTSLSNISVSEDNKNYMSMDGNLYSKGGKTLIQYAIGKTAKSFIVPDGVATIGEDAFRKATLTNVYLGNDVKEIKRNAFRNCANLASVVIPSNVEKIEDLVFYNCTKMAGVSILGEKTSLGNFVFDGCPIATAEVPAYAISSIPKTDLVSIEITAGDSIEKAAFLDCETLETVTLSGSIKQIGEYAFKGCIALSSINVAEENSTYKSVDGNVYSKDGKTLVQYAIGKSDEAATIAAGVTTIGKYSFSGGEKILSFKIPETVEKIEEYAFWDSINLTSITVSNNVSTIGEKAFDGCIKLVEIINKSSLKITEESEKYGGIGYYALTIHSGESSLINTNGFLFVNREKDGKLFLVNYLGSSNTVELPDETAAGGKYSVNRGAFYGNRNISSAIIGSSVLEVLDYSFENCTNLMNLEIAKEVQYIAPDAFKECLLWNITLSTELLNFFDLTEIQKVTLTSGESIAARTFENCTKLRTVEFPDTLISIGEYAFANTGIVSIKIPENVTSIGDNVFKDCEYINTARIPAFAIKYIPSETLQKLYVTSGTKIDDYVLEGYTKLKSVDICASVTQIGEGAFNGCTSLKTITVDEENETFKAVGNVLYSKDGTELVYYAAAKTEKEFTVPETVTTIGKYAFEGCMSLKNITIHGGVDNVAENAFENTSVVYASIPAAVAEYMPKDNIVKVVITSGTSIEAEAFKDCILLTSVTIPATITSIGENAFSGCEKLVEVINNSSLNIEKGSDANGMIGKNAMYVHSDGSKLIIDNGFIFINYDNEYYLLGQETNDSIVSLPANCNGENYKIYKYAFYGKEKIKELTIPDSVIEIGEDAFKDCQIEKATIPALAAKYIAQSKLTEVKITSGTSIEAEAFRTCLSLKTVTIADTVTEIGNKAFENCPIETATLPAFAVKYIQKDALTTVTITSGEIEAKAFENCSNLKEATIGKTVTKIGKNAFKGCSKLTKVTFNYRKWTVDASSFENDTTFKLSNVSDNAKYLVNKYCDYAWNRN